MSMIMSLHSALKRIVSYDLSSRAANPAESENRACCRFMWYAELGGLPPLCVCGSNRCGMPRCGMRRLTSGLPPLDKRDCTTVGTLLALWAALSFTRTTLNESSDLPQASARLYRALWVLWVASYASLWCV